jgi:hypothetical protein
MNAVTGNFQEVFSAWPPCLRYSDHCGVHGAVTNGLCWVLVARMTWAIDSTSAVCMFEGHERLTTAWILHGPIALDDHVNQVLTTWAPGF